MWKFHILREKTQTTSHESCRALVPSTRPLILPVRHANNTATFFLFSVLLGSVPGYIAWVLHTVLTAEQFTWLPANPRDLSVHKPKWKWMKISKFDWWLRSAKYLIIKEIIIFMLETIYSNFGKLLWLNTCKWRGTKPLPLLILYPGNSSLKCGVHNDRKKYFLSKVFT